MKKVLLLMGLFSISFCFSQNETTSLLGGSYYFFKAPPGEATTQKRSDGIEDMHVPLNAKVVYLYSDENKVYYSYWKWIQSNNSAENLNKLYVSFTPDSNAIKSDSPVPAYLLENLGKYFSMDIEEFEKITKPLYRRFKGFSAGAYTIPFRLRGSNDNFDFESALSLQANLIAGFGSQKNQESTYDFSFGIGLTGIKLNEKNSSVNEERSASAFTFSLGAVVKPAKYINAGLFVGWDVLGKNDREVNWLYNKKPWLGLGINLSFNEVSTQAAPSPTT